MLHEKELEGHVTSRDATSVHPECPQCLRNLIPVGPPGIPLLHLCPDRHGIWVELKNLNEVVEKREYILRAVEEPPVNYSYAVSLSKPCPQCRQSLPWQRTTPDFLICTSCQGCWLSQDGFDDLYKSYQSKISLAPYASSQEIQASRERKTTFFDTYCPNVTQRTLWLLFSLYLVISVPLTIYLVDMLWALVDPQEDGRRRLLEFLLMSTGAGASSFYYGIRMNKKADQVQKFPAISLEAFSPGIYDVVGKAEPDGTIIVTPFTEHPCVFYAWQIQRVGRYGSRTVSEGRSSQSFKITTGSMTLSALPDKADLFLTYSKRYENGPWKKLPIYLIEACKRLHTPVPKAFLGTLYFMEAFIAPGDEVFVLGSVKANPRVPNAFTIEKAKDGPFFIADHDEKTFVARLTWKVYVAIFGGSLLTAASLYVLFLLFTR
jgi:Zn-finger nucleic acid-binding protein